MAPTVAHADPLSPEGRALVAESQAALEAVYPPEDIFSFTAAELARPDTVFLVARTGTADGGPAAGCVALVDCGGYGEVKRLYVRPAARGTGAGRALMGALEAAAMAAGLAAVRLETGGRLAAALALYRRSGYRPRGPFGTYRAHPASLFMEKNLAPLPRRLAAGADGLPAVLALMQAAFAGHAGRIDPPSAVAAMDLAGLAAAASSGELWVLGEDGAPVAAALLTPAGGAMRIGRLAVAAGWRRRGLARKLVAVAEARARALGLPALEAQARVELEENHAALAALGFARVGAGAHPGHSRATFLTFRKPV
jgi:putative acetyltransferase